MTDNELIGSKINALLVRTTPRDVYDVYNFIKNNMILDKILVKKIAIFYACLGSNIPINFDDIINKAIEKNSKLELSKNKRNINTGFT